MSNTSAETGAAKQRPNKQITPFLRIGLWTAVVLHIIGFLLFQTASNYLPDQNPTRPYVTYVSNDSLAKDIELEEYAMLFDSAPLFIPTIRNAAQLVKVDFEDVSLGQFPEFEPQIELLSELQPTGLLIADDYQVNKPSDLLDSRFWRFFEGFGKSTETIAAFDQTAPVAEISIIGQSQYATSSLPVDLESAASLLITHPVSYTMRVADGGLVWSAPTLIETSGNEAFDQSVAQWLQRSNVLARLPEGYLSIRVFFW